MPSQRDKLTVVTAPRITSSPKIVCDLTVGAVIPPPGVRTGRMVIVFEVSREERLIRANSKSIKKPSAPASGGVSAGSIILPALMSRCRIP